MRSNYNRVAGIDVHRDFLTVSILDRKNGVLWSGDVPNNKIDIIKLKLRLKRRKIKAVAYESTGIYTERLERYLKGSWQLFKINPTDAANHDSRKTDRRDAVRLAHLLLGGIIGKQDAAIKGSIELDEGCLRFRFLTRKFEVASKDAARAATRLTNLVYQLELDFDWLCDDIASINGQYLLYAIAAEYSLEEWISDLENGRQATSKSTEKRPFTRCLGLIKQNLDKAHDALANSKAKQYGLLFILRETLLALIFARRQKISYHQAIVDYLANSPSLNHTVTLIMSVPGIGLLSAAILVAETGNFDRFATYRKYTSWLGLNPRVSQSANRKHIGKISKRGNAHIRRILYNNVTTMLRTPLHPICKFYRRLKKRKGENCGNLARTAAMRKVACLVFLLVTRNEPFHASKNVTKKWKGVSAPTLPLNYVSRLTRLLDAFSFEFPGSLIEFHQWLQCGTLPTIEPKLNVITKIFKQ